MQHFDVLLLFLVVRISSVFIVQTYFAPDEYWQSLEVAHKLVFNYGYLTWEWIAGIRSYIHPLIIAGVYKLLELSQLDTPSALIYGPRILQAVLTSYADLCFYEWSGSKKWAVFSISSSWFWFYTGSRTLINTFETALTTIALSKFPFPGKTKDEDCSFIWLIEFLFVCRPTSAIVWIPLCIYHFTFSQHSLLKLLMKYAFTGLIVLSLSVLIDSYAHGSLLFSGWEFVKYNVFKDISNFYGTQPWHWYLSSGFPAVLGIHFVPFLLAARVALKDKQAYKNECILLGTLVFTITVLSFLSHKEFRFLLPILPITLYLSSRYLSNWSRKTSDWLIWLVASVIFMANLAPAWYLSTVHQRGTLDVMTPLREIAQKQPVNTNFLFLMPCHSTPYYSHLHINVTARFLTCEPNFNSTINDYLDEADEFYKNPMFWLRKHYPPNGTLPSHIISFDSLVPSISDILSRYNLTHRLFHTDFPSNRIGRNVLIHELKH